MMTRSSSHHRDHHHSSSSQGHRSRSGRHHSRQHHSHHRRSEYSLRLHPGDEDFSFISPCVKYSLFLFNLVFWVRDFFSRNNFPVLWIIAWLLSSLHTSLSSSLSLLPVSFYFAHCMPLVHHCFPFHSHTRLVGVMTRLYDCSCERTVCMCETSILIQLIQWPAAGGVASQHPHHWKDYTLAPYVKKADCILLYPLYPCSSYFSIESLALRSFSILLLWSFFLCRMWKLSQSIHSPLSFLVLWLFLKSGRRWLVCRTRDLVFSGRKQSAKHD